MTKDPTIGFLCFDNDLRERCLSCLESLSKVSGTNYQVVSIIADTNSHIITVGGDGTVLAGANEAWKHGIPLIGVSAGHLGFLSMNKVNSEMFRIPHSPDVMFSLLVKALIEKNCPDLGIQKRKVLECNSFSMHAFNEIGILSAFPGKMVEIEISVNGEVMSKYQGDGAILSTPTGSTAYNLSAGGPIVHPSADVIAITPISSFSMSARPMIVPGDSKIDFRILSEMD